MKRRLPGGAVARLFVLLAVCAAIAAAYIIASVNGALPVTMNDSQLTAQYGITSED